MNCSSFHPDLAAQDGLELGVDRGSALRSDTPPLAMQLRSGDVVVQGGESRSFYHGVPRILKESSAPPEYGAAVDAELMAVGRWLQQHRININVRQVFAAGASTLAQTEDALDAEASRKRRRVDADGVSGERPDP